MNKVGIIQVDGKIPNLALMQITKYHELLGDKVERWQGPLWNNEYDLVYASKIFNFSQMPNIPEHTIKGGTGIDWLNRLPDEIAEHYPSYSLYPDCNYHLGFTMKGCRFSCSFCVVPKKEGRPRDNATIDELLINPNGGNRLMLMDNDFFGVPKWEKNIRRIIDLKLKVCFVQGLNIRIITKEQAELLAQTNYCNSHFKDRYLTFAWDRIYDEDAVMRGIEICNKAGIPTKNMQFFVLIGYQSKPENDYYRVMKLKELGAMPFIMPYNKKDPYQRAFVRWVNRRAIFKTVKWEDYNRK